MSPSSCASFSRNQRRRAPARRSRRVPTRVSVVLRMEHGRRLRDPRAMQPIRRILVAVKNPAARVLPAVNKAAQIAKGLNAQLTLFHDIATPLYAEALQGREIDLQSWQREVQTARREQLEKVAARIRKHGVH